MGYGDMGVWEYMDTKQFFQIISLGSNYLKQFNDGKMK